MVADGRYVAVLDRFEDEQAVLLLEDDDEVIAERIVPTGQLPEDARRRDAVLHVSVRDGLVASMDHDPEATERRAAAAQSRFDRLAKRPAEDSGDGDEYSDGTGESARGDEDTASDDEDVPSDDE